MHRGAGPVFLHFACHRTVPLERRKIIWASFRETRHFPVAMRAAFHD